MSQISGANVAVVLQSEGFAIDGLLNAKTTLGDWLPGSGSSYLLNSSELPLTGTERHLTDAYDSYSVFTCSGSPFNFTEPGAIVGETYSWSTPQVVPSGAIINGLSLSGQGSVTQSLTNISTTAATATYTVTTSTGTSFQLVVTVNPVPSVPTQSPTICSGTAFNIIPTNVPGNTTYTWTKPTVSPTGAINATEQLNPQLFIGQTLTNATVNPATVNYTVTPATGTCVGQSFLVSVLVNPMPVLNNSNLAPSSICSGTSFDYSPNSATSGTAVTWSRAYTSGITNTRGDGNGNVSEVLTNSTTNPISVNYVFTLNANSCSNNQTVPVTVNPMPILSSELYPPGICSGSTFNYTASTSAANPVYTWSRATITGISNSPMNNVAGNNISELIVNTTSRPIEVIYSFLLSDGLTGCSSVPQLVRFYVNPTPNFVDIPVSSCSGTIFLAAPNNAPTGTKYSWSTPTAVSGGAVSGGSAEPVGQFYVGQKLSNNGTAGTVDYTVTPNINGCLGSQFHVIVTVSNGSSPTLQSSLNPPSICSNDIFNYTPSSSSTGVSYAWTRFYSSGFSPTTSSGTNSISEKLTNNSTRQMVAYYGYTLTGSDGCSNTQEIQVIVNPVTTLSSSLSPLPVCSNTIFSYTPTSLAQGSGFTWQRAQIDGISNSPASGTDNPNETLINTTNQDILVTYSFTITPPSGCVNTENVSVLVKTVPVLNSLLNPAPVCSGLQFAYTPGSNTPGASFNWSRAVSPSISNGAGIGVGNVAEILVNTSTSAVTVPYDYIITANGCSNHQIVNALVNPAPNIPNQTSNICNRGDFNISPANTPPGTEYTWGSPVYSPANSINGGTAQTSLQSSISQSLTNTTLSTATANYTVMPVTNGCYGTPFTLAVNVSTATTLSSGLNPPAVCSNTSFSYTPTSNTPNTSFSWTRAPITGISNPAASGINNPNETLINTTSQTIPVVYTYSLNTPNGCANLQTLTVAVHPLPVLTSLLYPTPICSGSTFSYTPGSNIAGATYSWTRTVLPSISNGPGAGSGLTAPSEILVNTSNNPVTVPYNYTITANGCTNYQIVNEIVYPIPRVANQAVTICGNTSFNTNPINVPPGTQYKWGLPAITPVASLSGYSAQSVLQNSVSQQLINQTLNSAFAEYTVTPIANGCMGTPFSVNVTVNPVPVISNQLLNPVCSGSAFSYTPINIPASTTFTWNIPILSPSNSLTGASAEPISRTAISQTLSSTNNLSDTATYTVIPATAGCEGNSFTVSVPVNPLPVVNNIFDTICTGSAFSIVPDPVPANTTYTWPTPVNVPFGAIIGSKAQPVPVTTLSQNLINSSNAIAKAVYSITPSAAGCVGAPFSLTETVGINLAPIANRTAVICSETSFDLTPVTARPNTKYTWNNPTVIPAGTVLGYSAQNVPQPTISQTLNNLSAVADTVVYTIVPYNTGCVGNTFTATVNVLPVPKATLTGKPVVCRYPFDTLSVSFTGTAPWSFSYLDNGVAKTQTGIMESPFTWVIPSLPITANRTLAINYVKDKACVDSVDTSYFVQKINPLPAAQINSLHGLYICNNIPDTLLINHAPADSLNFQWTRNGTFIPGATGDLITTLLPGRYNAVLTNQYNCVDTAAAAQELILILKPNLNFSYDSYCTNKLIHFNNLTDTSFMGATQWRWDMDDSTTFRNTFHATNTYTRTGYRHIKLTATPLNCLAYATTMDSGIHIDSPLPALRIPSVSAYSRAYTPIAARSLPDYQYLWTPTRGIDHPDSAAVNFNYQLTQEYLINLISPAGCVTTDSVLVRVFDDKLVNLFVPKSFTPNGDGVNDILYPYLSGIKTFQYFKVYNRFGKLMFESRDPDAGWNGRLNGIEQPFAIYIWVSAGIANDGSLVEKRGETLLLR